MRDSERSEEPMSPYELLLRIAYARSPLPTNDRRDRRDSDLWAIYTRTCLGQALNMSAKAALNEDPDVEASSKTHVQPARRAPGKKGR
jgi:hypothetical protein